MGMDAEPDFPMLEGVLRKLSPPGERRLVMVLRAFDSSHAWDRLLSLAKEQVYEAWWLVMHRWLGFEENLATVDPSVGTFTVHAVKDNAKRRPILGGAHGR